MNTPPPQFSLPELDVRELGIKLRQVTPEIDFPQESAHSSRWSAELAAHGLEAAVIDHERHKISVKNYWQVEALGLLELYLKQSKDNNREVERWRNICIGIKSLLKQQGADVDKLRRSIDNEGYWELERDRLKQYSARLENELLHDSSANDNANANGNGQKLPSPCPQLERRRKSQRQYYRQRRLDRKSQAARCHGRALRSASAKVAKRHDIVGGNPANLHAAGVAHVSMPDNDTQYDKP